MSKQEIISRIRDARVVLVLDTAAENAAAMARAAVDASVWAMEVPLAEDTSGFKALVEEQLGLILGTSGVDSAQRAWDAVEAGARFLTSTAPTAEIAAVAEAASVPLVAAVDGLPSLEAALPSRPDFVRIPSEVGVLPPEDGPLLMLELVGNTPAELARSAGPEAAVVAVRLESLGATSWNELPAKLRELLAELPPPP